MIEHFIRNAPFYIALIVIALIAISAFTGRQLEISKTGFKFGSVKQETNDLKDNLKIILKAVLSEHRYIVHKEVTIENNKDDVKELKKYVLRNIEDITIDINNYFMENILDKQKKLDKRKVNYICDYWELYVHKVKIHAIKFSMDRIEENGFDKMDEEEFFKYKKTIKKTMIEELKKHSRQFNRIHKYLNMYFQDTKYDDYEVRDKYEQDMEDMYEKLNSKLDEMLVTIRNEMIEVYTIQKNKLEDLETEWEKTYNHIMEKI